MLWVLHSCRDEYLVAVDEPPPKRGQQGASTRELGPLNRWLMPVDDRDHAVEMIGMQHAA
jgi:hypothetical protein